jgi:hypothetical protein
MRVALVVYDGMFDSGLAAILDVLSNANALGGEIDHAPTWDVTMVGPKSQVRTGAGLLVAPQPLERAHDADPGTRTSPQDSNRARSSTASRICRRRLRPANPVGSLAARQNDQESRSAARLLQLALSGERGGRRSCRR